MMKMTKFKTVSDTDLEEFDAEIGVYVNNKWQLHGDVRTITKDGITTHYQTLMKQFELATDEAKELFTIATHRAGDL
jgi:hypothetical protein